jgi:hypothetical protein
MMRCLNPAHNDRDPSMAVYDHGQEKLQVYCFGCHYHAWVLPEDIHSWNKPGSLTVGDVSTLVTNAGSIQYTPKSSRLFSDEMGDELTQFFRQRNMYVPASKHNITYGVEPGGVPTGSGLLCADGRSFMEWSVYDLFSTKICSQRRYLDTLRPKTRYIDGHPNNQEQLFSTTLTNGFYSDGVLHICESAIDCVFVDQCIDHDKINRRIMWINSKLVNLVMPIDRHSVLSTMGTPTTLNWYELTPKLKKYDHVFLWYDGDTPGNKTIMEIGRWLTASDISYNVPNAKANVYDYTGEYLKA